MSVLNDLQEWYAAHCDGQWEEQFGIEISTISNPGWMISIDLIGTNLAGRSCPALDRTGPTDDDWIMCRVEDNKFVGSGDPGKLDEIIQRFLSWAKAGNDAWLQPPPPPTPEQQQLADDKEFWLSLGEEVGPQTCSSDRCCSQR